MIRSVDFTINHNLIYEERASIGSKNRGSEWRHSVHYLDEKGSLFKQVSKGCRLAQQISYLASLKPITGAVGTVARRLGQASELANFFTTAESFSSFIEGQKLGLNLETAKEVLKIADMGLDLISWFSIVEKLGLTVTVASRLTSMSLASALLYPMIDLILHLRSEGLVALQGPQLYKASYKLGLALLAVYLFMTSATVSMYLGVVIASINFAMQYPDCFDQAYDLYSSFYLNNELQFQDDF